MTALQRCQSKQQLSYFATKGIYRNKPLEAIQLNEVSTGERAIKPFLVSRKRNNVEKDRNQDEEGKNLQKR